MYARIWSGKDDGYIIISYGSSLLETRYIGAIDYPPFKERLTPNRVVQIEIGDVTTNSHMSTDDMQLTEFSSVNINNVPADVFGMWTCTKLPKKKDMCFSGFVVSANDTKDGYVEYLIQSTAFMDEWKNAYFDKLPLILENDRITVSWDAALTKMLFGCVPTGHIEGSLHEWYDEYMSLSHGDKSRSEIIVRKDKDSHFHIHSLPNDFAEYWISTGTKACIGAIGKIAFIAMVPFAFEPSKKKSAKTNNEMVAKDPAASFRRHVVNK